MSNYFSSQVELIKSDDRAPALPTPDVQSIDPTTKGQKKWRLHENFNLFLMLIENYVYFHLKCISAFLVKLSGALS